MLLPWRDAWLSDSPVYRCELLGRVALLAKQLSARLYFEYIPLSIRLRPSFTWFCCMMESGYAYFICPEILQACKADSISCSFVISINETVASLHIFESSSSRWLVYVVSPGSRFYLLLLLWFLIASFGSYTFLDLSPFLRNCLLGSWLLACVSRVLVFIWSFSSSICFSIIFSAAWVKLLPL